MMYESVIQLLPYYHLPRPLRSSLLAVSEGNNSAPITSASAPKMAKSATCGSNQTSKLTALTLKIAFFSLNLPYHSMTLPTPMARNLSNLCMIVRGSEAFLRSRRFNMTYFLLNFVSAKLPVK